MTGKSGTVHPVDIRPAMVSDYPAICQLISSRDELFRVFPSGSWPFNIRQVHHLAEHRSDLTVITDNGEVIGFANLYDIQPQHWAFVGNVIIRASHRGKGIGERLLRYMLNIIFTKVDLPQARISVFEDNSAAFKLYTKLGFTIYDREERIDRSKKKVILLHMRLGKPS